MKRQAAGLVELGLAHGERGGLQVDVAQREHQRFGQPEAGRCDQPEQTAVGQRSKRPGMRERGEFGFPRLTTKGIGSA